MTVGRSQKEGKARLSDGGTWAVGEAGEYTDQVHRGEPVGDVQADRPGEILG